MAKAKLYSGDGTYKSDIDLPDSYFNQPVSETSIHSYITIYSGNQRQGTSKTKSRSEVSGSGKKPWKQKGTGRARSGTNSSPIWVRGGKAHGVTPRSYARKLNRKLKQQALRSALSIKASQNLVHVFESLQIPEPKTRNLAGIMDKASISTRKTRIFVSEPDPNLFLAARNIPSLQVCRIQDINAYEIMNSDNLILTESSLSSLTAEKELANESV
ncbi:50S ribosomal protein L4 [Fibrobacterota bacterium]